MASSCSYVNSFSFQLEIDEEEDCRWPFFKEYSVIGWMGELKVKSQLPCKI